MTDYSKLTNERFDEILTELVNDNPASLLLSIPGVYECVAEEYNNAVLDVWEREQGLVEEDKDPQPNTATVQTVLDRIADLQIRVVLALKRLAMRDIQLSSAAALDLLEALAVDVLDRSRHANGKSRKFVNNLIENHNL